MQHLGSLNESSRRRLNPDELASMVVLCVRFASEEAAVLEELARATDDDELRQLLLRGAAIEQSFARRLGVAAARLERRRAD